MARVTDSRSGRSRISRCIVKSTWCHWVLARVGTTCQRPRMVGLSGRQCEPFLRSSYPI